jgi:hypothetical protein
MHMQNGFLPTAITVSSKHKQANNPISGEEGEAFFSLANAKAHVGTALVLLVE